MAEKDKSKKDCKDIKDTEKRKKCIARKKAGKPDPKPPPEEPKINPN